MARLLTFALTYVSVYLSGLGQGGPAIDADPKAPRGER